MALSVVTQQQAKALTESQKSMIMKFTSECIKELGLPADHILTKAESMTGCKDALKHLFNQEMAHRHTLMFINSDSITNFYFHIFSTSLLFFYSNPIL